MTRATRSGAAVAVAAALLFVAGCGEDEEGPNPGGNDPTSEETTEAEGPECVGDEATAGTHVLRGGEATLPGGGTVTYEEARSDGSTRQAGLTQGGGGGGPELLGPDEELTVAGNAYTVSQICAYRVVLTSDDPELAPDPVEPDPEWPDAGGGEWTLHQGVTDDQPDEPSLSVALTSTEDDPPAATILVKADGGVTVAFYEDVAVGATVEIADRLWEVTDVTSGGAPSASLNLLGPAAS